MPLIGWGEREGERERDKGGIERERGDRDRNQWDSEGQGQFGEWRSENNSRVCTLQWVITTCCVTL